MKNIRLLEDRVSRAVGRLRELSAEKQQLESELATLREQLDGFEQVAADASDDGREGWKDERALIVSSLRETLRELRTD